MFKPLVFSIPVIRIATLKSKNCPKLWPQNMPKRHVASLISR